MEQQQYDVYSISAAHKKCRTLQYTALFYYANNMNIVDSSDVLLAIWDKKSRGTKSTIEYAQIKKKPIHFFYYNKIGGNKK